MSTDNLPSVTVADVMKWRPCYTHNQVKALFAGRKRLTALDILDLEVRVADRLWAVLREPFFTRDQTVSLACVFAEHVLPIFEAHFPGDKRPRQAIDAARLGRGISAATNAATNAANAAAYAAAAANAAAYAADTTRRTEENWQLDRIRQVIQSAL